MYRSIQDFISDFQMESDNTLKIFMCISEEKKDLRVNDHIRSMERLSWHVTQTLSEMMFRCGFTPYDEIEDKPIPHSFQAIAKSYKQMANLLLETVPSKWNDSELQDEIEIYGQRWSKGFLLRSIITHEIHHRGQLTVIMRYFGLPVPGIYGPSREEWAKYQMPAQE
jgi:uncharacterized damage-inducible protein DinB